ncbi:hypothetical protein IP88_14570 [alpha proteobacterium AAP81b]|nr:hypothetical protein IP88_14570 [alpha proteobacterium AAP81b]
MRFWAFIALLYLLIFSGMAVLLSGGTAVSAFRDTGRAIRDFAVEAGDGGLWNWLANRGRAIEDACTH